jgi:energy-coupling factor transporter ATP-binding protein EcfA2
MTDQSGGPKPLKIVGLLAENIKRITAVEINPDGSLVEITGKNGAGKSSVLDSISWAIEGAKHIQARPIRNGWTQAKIRLDLGEFEVTRRFRDVPDGEGGSRIATDLEVHTANGTPVRRPQEMLNALLSALAFDPVAFMQAREDERFEIMKRFVPEVDFERYALDHARDFEERTHINRQARDLDAQARALPADMGATGEPIDEGALIAKLRDVNERTLNRERAATMIEQARRDCRRQSQEAEDFREEAARLIARAEKLEAEIIKQVEAADHQQARLDAAEPLPSTADIERELIAARAHNAKIVGRGERLKLLKRADEAKAKAAALTAQMERREAEKQKRIAEAAMPVPGIGFDGDRITLGGFPFDQASTAEQLRASVGLAMAQNPRLRVLLIREASLIDEDGMRLLADLARDKGFQIWTERVQASGVVPTILIQDGAIKRSEV